MIRAKSQPARNMSYAPFRQPLRDTSCNRTINWRRPDYRHAEISHNRPQPHERYPYRYRSVQIQGELIGISSFSRHVGRLKRTSQEVLTISVKLFQVGIQVERFLAQQLFCVVKIGQC